MEIKIISKTQKGKEALLKMYAEKHNSKVMPGMKVDTYIDSQDPYALRIEWSGVLAKAMDKNPLMKQQLILGIKSLIPKYKCTEEDMEVV